MAKTITEFNELINSIRSYLSQFENKAFEIIAIQENIVSFSKHNVGGFLRGNLQRKIKRSLVSIRKNIKLIYKNNEEFEEKINNLKQSINYIQIRKYSKNFSDLQKRRKVMISFFIRFYSRSGRLWLNRLNSQEIILAIKNSRKGGVVPFFAIIKSYKELIQKIEKDINLATFNFNLDNIMNQVRAPLNLTTILIDSDFITNVYNYSRTKRKLLRLINHGRIEITREVEKEILKVKGTSPLIGKDIRSQLFSIASVINVAKNGVNDRKIINAWLDYSPKASNEKIPYFRTTGDYKIMLRALELSPSPVIILSNDSDIYKTIGGLHGEGKYLNIMVYSFGKENGSVNIAA